MKTKKITQLLTLAFCAIAFAFVTSCEGPMGPAGTNGTDGADGTNGTNGTDGTPGVDGNVSCLECHTQAGMDALHDLYDQSGHASASTTSYAGGRASCARCHSNEGFTNYLTATPGVDAADIAYPSKIRCSTCHSNHSSLEDGISAPMVTEATVIAYTDGTTEFDFGNVSNLCANCHQSRKNGDSYDKYTTDQTFVRKFTDADDIAAYTTAAVGPTGSIVLDQSGTTDTLVVTFDVPTTHVYISSTHAGPHHGPQTNNLFGVGGYGTSSTATHTTQGCVTCHMGEAGTSVGGHSFYPNVANCQSCHSGATDFDINGKQTDFDARMLLIAEALEAVHAVHIDAGTGEVHPAYASVPRAEFEAFWNFMILMDTRDGS